MCHVFYEDAFLWGGGGEGGEDGGVGGFGAAGGDAGAFGGLGGEAGSEMFWTVVVGVAEGLVNTVKRGALDHGALEGGRAGTGVSCEDDWEM